MTQPIATIDAFMTPHPHSIGRDQPLARAHAFMGEHRIRHLPVLDGGRLVGLLSDRDLHLIESLRDVDPTLLLVDEAMSIEVYAVRPETPLEEVTATMAERKYGCAVVLDRYKVVGVFTTVDACRALSALLKARRPSA
jgi:acetoin utilization protein AcuB